MIERDIDRPIIVDTQHIDAQVVKGRIITQVNIVNGVKQERKIQEPDTEVPARTVVTIICPNCGHIFNQFETPVFNVESIMKSVESAFDINYCYKCGQKLVLYTDTIVGEVVEEKPVEDVPVETTEGEQQNEEVKN